MIKNLGQVAAIYVGETVPRNVNMIWLDNTVIPYVFKSYNGEEWTEIPTGAWVETYVNGWLVSLRQGTVTTDDDYLLINSGDVNYKMTVRDFVKSSVGNPLDFKGVIRTDADFPNPSTLESGDMYIIITNPTGGTVTDPYSGKTFSDSEKIVWDSVINSWASLGKIDVKVDLSTTYSATEVTIHSSAGKETTVVGVTDDNAGVMVTVQKKWLDALSDGSTLTPQGPSTSPYHKHRYADIVDRIISQQVTGDSAINPMSQKATTEALNLKLDKSAVLQVPGVSTTDVMSQKAVTDAISAAISGIGSSKYALLAGNNTFSGSNTFALNKFQVGTGSLFRVNADANLIVDGIVKGGWDKELVYYSREASSSTAVKRGAFGIKADGATEPLDTDYLYLSVGEANWKSAQYKFRADKLIVPNTWSLRTISDFSLIKVDDVNGVRFGYNSIPNYLVSNNTDITHVRGSDNYKIYDSYNLPNPVQKTDLASYLPLAGGTLTGDLVLSNNNYIKGILSTGTPIQILGLTSSNTILVGNGSYNLLLYTGASDISHWKGGTSYKIWDASNVSRPLNYVNGTAGSVTSVYTRNLNLNGTSYPFIGTGTTVVTLFAPTTAGTSGQVLQSQGAGKAPIWVNGGTGGGVQLSDTNVWTGLNTFQGGLKTSDGTNSYDVWDNNSLKYPVKYAINSTGTGYALSFYSKTAGWKEIDTLTTKYLTSATVRSMSAGGDGYIGIGTNAYASAAISNINTNSIYFRGLNNTVLSTNDDGKLEYGSSSNYAGFNSGNIRIAYPIVSSSGGGGGGGGTTDPSEGGLTIGYYPANTISRVMERAKIYCTTVNLYLKDLAKNTRLDFDTDGLYVTTGSSSKVRLATLNDISGSGGVSLSDNNTWTGTNTFKSTVQMQSEDLTDDKGTQTCGYDIQMTDLARTVNFKLEGHLDRDPIFKVTDYNFAPIAPYATLTVGSGLFTFNESGSLTTKISGTNYEFWNKNNLAKPIIYNTNSDGGCVIYKGDSTSNRIDILELAGILPPMDGAVPLSNGGTGMFGNIDNAYAEAYIGDVHANNIIVSKIPVKDSENYFEIAADGMYFYDTVNQIKYKLTMEVVS